MPYDDPHWMGGIGMIGTKPVYNAIMHCDLLLMLGTDYPYWDSCRVTVLSSRSTKRAHVLGGVRRLRSKCVGSVHADADTPVGKVAAKTDTNPGPRDRPASVRMG